MFDFAWSEFALIGIVGLLFIGPKDMPVAIRTVTNLLKKGRKLAGEFQTHVDEMVREADLGEARDQFRQLRSFNVRGQIMKAIDKDGTLQQTLGQKPFAGVGPRFAPPSQSLPAGVDGVPEMAGMPATDGMAPVPVSSGIDRSWRPEPVPPALDDAALAAADPAPAIIPPRVASRLRAERARPMPPRFVPPQPLYSNPAIRPGGAPHPDYRPGAGLT